MPATATPSPLGDGVVRVLIAGIDAKGRETDTLALLTFDRAGTQVGLVSLPPQAVVTIAGLGKSPLRAAYAAGGIKLTAKGAANLLQQEIHHYVRCDMVGFAKLVDALGGLEMTIAAPMHYADRASGLRIDLPAGTYRLDGAKALQFVRYQSDGEAARLARQQQFFGAVVARLADPPTAASLPAAVAALAGHIETSLSAVQLAAIFRLISDPGTCIQKAVLPGHAARGAFAPASSAAELVPALEQGQAPPAYRPSVTVYNASDRLGLERLACDQLAAAGYEAVPGRTPTVPSSPETLVYSVDDPAAAAQVAGAVGAAAKVEKAPAALPPSRSEAIDAAPRVVLVLGCDWPE